tara:strand:+ start:167 stop:316 length:150 start_codon:yes stop_codon:yes gene_type:complete
MIQEELFLEQVIAEQAHQAFLVDVVFWVGVLAIIALQVWIRIYFKIWRK